MKLAGALLDFQRIHFLAVAAELGLLPLLGRTGSSLTALSDVSSVEPANLSTFLKTGEKLRLVRVRNGRYELQGWSQFLADTSEHATVGRLRETHRLDSFVWSEVADRLRHDTEADPLSLAGPAVSAASHALDDCILPVLESLDIPKAGRILDVGCGDGGHLRSMLRDYPARTAVGLEMDELVAKFAEKVTAESGLGERIHIVTGTLDALGSTERFDVVVAMQMLYYVEPAVRVHFFEEMRGRLCAEGILVLVFLQDGSDPMTAQYPLLFERSRGLWPPPNSVDVGRALDDAGFTHHETRRLTPGAGPVAMVARR